jgi:hypothetical protein
VSYTQQNTYDDGKREKEKMKPSVIGGTGHFRFANLLKLYQKFHKNSFVLVTRLPYSFDLPEKREGRAGHE